MAITFFGQGTTPADGASATNTADPTAVTPPSSMTAGDLVLLIGQQRATGVEASLAISATGGQTWNDVGVGNNTLISVKIWWARYNGTWSADPSVDFTATTCNSVQMLVFRPTASGNLWFICNALSEANDTVSNPTITGQTTTGTQPTVSIAGWHTADDNTWGTLTGAGWDKTGLSAQFRNTSGSDQSATYAYEIQTTGGATGNVTQTQLTLGADNSSKWIVSFAEYAAITISPAVGAITATGQTPIVGGDHVETPAAGSLAATGQTPTVTAENPNKVITVASPIVQTFATWNPSDKSVDITLSNGNLSVSHASGGYDSVRATIGLTSGKWFWEITGADANGSSWFNGVMNSSADLNNYIGFDANGWGYGNGDGNKYNNGNLGSYGATYTDNDVIGVALDMGAGTLAFYKNGVSQGTAFSTGLTGTLYPALASAGFPTGTIDANFGASTFAYSVPSGFNSGVYTETITQTTFTGAAPTLVVVAAVGISTDAGALAFTGTTPSLLDSNPLKVSQVVAEVLIKEGSPSLLASQVVAEVLIKEGSPSLRASQVVAEVLIENNRPWTYNLTLTGVAPTVVVAAGVVEVNILVDAGSVTLTGQVPTISTDVAIPVDAGALTFTGNAPSAIQYQTIEVSVGSLVLTGTAPSFGLNFAVNAGTLSFTGQEPTLNVGAAISVAVGALTFTGQTPAAIQYQIINVDTGSLTLNGVAFSFDSAFAVNSQSLAVTGYAPTLVRNHIIEVSAGSASFSGLAPSGEISYTLAVGAGSMQLTGQALTVFNTLVASPNAGSLALTGYAPSLLQQYNITVAAGSLSWTGSAPSMDSAYAVAAGSLAITGSSPSLKTEVIALPNVGSLSFTGTQSTLLIEDTSAVDSGAMTLTGYAPQLQAGEQISVSSGSLLLTNATPSLRFDYVISTNYAALTLAGYAPVIAVHYQLATNAGSLAFTGYTPVVQTSEQNTVGKGSLFITGEVPSLRFDYVISTEYAALTLAGYAPTRLIDYRLSADVGSLTLIGYAPLCAIGTLVNIDTTALQVSGEVPQLVAPVGVSIAAGALQFNGTVPVLALAGEALVMVAGGITLRPAVSADPRLEAAIDAQMRHRDAVSATSAARKL